MHATAKWFKRAYGKIKLYCIIEPYTNRSFTFDKPNIPSGQKHIFCLYFEKYGDTVTVYVTAYSR